MAVKTDMSKAYDRLEWGFIEAVLTNMGFAIKWITWVMRCIDSVFYAFLINGSPQGSVKPSRGIRQGDPLSPYVFILCTEVLSALFDKAMLDGSLAGVRVSCHSPSVNHLLFADDTMFFCKSNPTSVTTLGSILRQYEELSGQRINLLKSSITFSAKTPPEVKQRVNCTLSIEAEGGVGKYPGLPEHFGRKKRDIFASIVDRIRQKAFSWTSRFLSGAGKQVLLEAVLSAMPCYAISCFKIPISLCKQIQSILTRFWWDANPEKRKMCWVAWDTLTQPKYAGGLGFRDIETFNDSLIGKIGWRLISNPESLLAHVLLGKYAWKSSFMDCSVPSAASHGWRSIIVGRELLRKGLSWTVGNGEDIRVWQDPWISCDTSTTPFGPPTLMSIDLRVSDLLCPLSNDWDLEKVRAVLPHYEDEIRSLITSSAPSRDRFAWLPDKPGLYTTRSGFRVGMNLLRGPEMQTTPQDPATHSPFDWLKNIWNIHTAPKIKNFLWRVARKAIPVSENLASRGITPFFCKSCGGIEDDLHVFIHCHIAAQVWELVPMVSIPSPLAPSIKTLISEALQLINLPPSGVAIPLWPWVLWSLWKARNTRCFEDRTYSGTEIVSKAVSDAREWQDS